MTGKSRKILKIIKKKAGRNKEINLRILKYGFIFIIFFTAMIFLVQGTRIPTVGGDSGTWGTVLNDFLQTEHTDNGTHQNVSVRGEFKVTNDTNTNQTFFIVNYSSGNIGINTTTPTHKLNIVGDVNITGILYGGTLNISGDLIVNDSVLYINGSTGNIGIGTTTPWAQLNIKEQGTDHPFVISDTSNNTQFMVEKSNGFVGIGTDNPTQMFKIDRAAGAANVMVFSQSGTILTTIGITGTAGGVLPNTRANDLGIRHENDIFIGAGGFKTSMVIRSSGNIGIGTNSSNAKLEILGNASNGLALNITGVLYVNGTSMRVGINNTSPTTALEIGNLNSGQQNITLYSPNGTAFNCGVNNTGAFTCSG